MKYPQAMLAAFSILVLSLAPLAPAAAGGPGPWVGAHAFGHFGLGAALAHSLFGLATLPLVIIGADAAAESQNDQGYAPQQDYYAARPGYFPPPPDYHYAPRAAYAPPAVYYAPRPAYYPPAPRFYAPRMSTYGRPGGYYGGRPGYYAPSGYQAARRSSYYHYPR